jgi:heptosyltransferase II
LGFPIPSRRRPIDLAALRRVLVVRYRFFGDTILTVPFLRNLRRAVPGASVDVLVAPRSGSMLEGCPYVDDLIVYDTTRFHRYDGAAGDPKTFGSYVKLLRARRYDAVFLLKKSFRAAMLGYAIRAPIRVGHATERRGFLLTHRAPYDPKAHEVESTLDVLRAAGIPVVDDHLEAFPDKADAERLRSEIPELASPRPKILLHATAAVPYRLYPEARWAQVVATLVREHKAVLFHTGAAEDAAVYERVATTAGVRSINLAGKLEPRPSLALYSMMDAAVGVDSGPMHMAAACGTPTITLFGPTDPLRWKPWGDAHVAVYDDDLPCRPCSYRLRCGGACECMSELDPARIVAAVRTALQRRPLKV